MYHLLAKYLVRERGDVVQLMCTHVQKHMSVVLDSVRLVAALAERMRAHTQWSILKTLLGGWCTSNRMHEECRLDCAFGCRCARSPSQSSSWERGSSRVSTGVVPPVSPFPSPPGSSFGYARWVPLEPLLYRHRVLLLLHIYIYIYIYIYTHIFTTIFV